MINGFALPSHLYGSAGPSHNPGEDQDVDRGRAAPQERPGAGVAGGPRGQHIVDQHQLAPDDLDLAIHRTRKAPCTFWARPDLSSPTCCGVALTRLSAPWATG